MDEINVTVFMKLKLDSELLEDYDDNIEIFMLDNLGMDICGAALYLEYSIDDIDYYI